MRTRSAQTTVDNNVTALCIGLPPIVAPNPHTLILGSMPGVRSLQLQQYYGHPQNAFWKIMSALFGGAVDSYEARVALIRSHRLALWDTLKCCVRPGSLDAEIDDASIEVNDFESFFAAHPTIDRVFFNGGKSALEFKRRVMPTLPQSIRDRLRFKQLPSTSPAHAGRSFADKLELWRDVAAGSSPGHKMLPAV